MANVTTTDADLIRRTETVTIPAGQPSVNIIVPVRGDTEPEDDETFEVRLDNIRGGVLLEAVGTGTIVDDDTLPAAELTTVDGSAYESETQIEGVLFAVTPASAATGTSVEVAVTGGSATTDDDFTVATSVPGTDGLVDISLVDDDVQAPTETVDLLLTLRDGDGTQLDTATATFTIYDDDNTTVVTRLPGQPPDRRRRGGRSSRRLRLDRHQHLRLGRRARSLVALTARHRRWRGRQHRPRVDLRRLEPSRLQGVHVGVDRPTPQEFGFTLVGEPDRGGIRPPPVTTCCGFGPVPREP